MDYEKLTKDLATAKRDTMLAIMNDNDDGGTCNFDTPILLLKGVRMNKLESAAVNAGVRISKWGTGYYHINGDFLCGQGNIRTKCAETFAKSLRSNGWEAYVYYAMD